jgi:hypothetical protein
MRLNDAYERVELKRDGVGKEATCSERHYALLISHALSLQKPTLPNPIVLFSLSFYLMQLKDPAISNVHKFD